ncbi:hypothetical protein B0H16DRAFT_1719332 [Mycena metata]|uniref:Uncharacterized protein n=1 Tax=Mycena metata TaxID=1033252 RepID=A0AAD7JEI1_9AGAR|nr:hypothetical protein B0H16DRAFT_1719332 [Mycena metata]
MRRHRASNNRPEITTLPPLPYCQWDSHHQPHHASIRKALIIHPRNLGHNHPMPALKKPSLGASGLSVVLVRQSPSYIVAPSTQLLLDGKKPGEFAPALHSNQIKRKLVREAKMEAYPAGLDLAGAFQLLRDALRKPVDERHIQRLVTMPDGGVIILTGLAALVELLDDMGVTSFETDTTFKGVEGEINEWEVVIFLKSLQRGQNPHSSFRWFFAANYIFSRYNCSRIRQRHEYRFFERLYDEFRPLNFKCFFEGGNLLALNSHMEGAQVLGATCSFIKTNNPDYSGISRDTPAERVAPKFLKLCTTHGKRAVLDFWSLLSESEYQRLIDFPYIESEEDLNDDWARQIHAKSQTMVFHWRTWGDGVEKKVHTSPNLYFLNILTATPGIYPLASDSFIPEEYARSSDPPYGAAVMAAQAVDRNLLYWVAGVYTVAKGQAGQFSFDNWGDLKVRTPTWGNKLTRRATKYLASLKAWDQGRWDELREAAEEWKESRGSSETGDVTEEEDEEPVVLSD